MSKGSLVFVGSGIRGVGQTTIEAWGHIKTCDKLFYLVTEPVTEHWLRGQNPTAECLKDCYEEDGRRVLAYERMVQRILAPVRAGKSVTAVFYGHPGVFVNPSFAAIRLARAEGHDACMLPGVSAEDCLFADLEVDPSTTGCASFEATDFLLRERRPDPSAMLLLWQIGVLGNTTFRKRGDYVRRGMPALVEYLGRYYPPTHKVAIYQAAQLAFIKPTIDWVGLQELAGATIPSAATLFIPAAEKRTTVPAMLAAIEPQKVPAGPES